MTFDEIKKALDLAKETVSIAQELGDLIASTPIEVRGTHDLRSRHGMVAALKHIIEVAKKASARVAVTQSSLEDWRAVDGWHWYQVSNFGGVRYSPPPMRIGQPTEEPFICSPSTSTGYARVHLSQNGKRKSFAVHRLVLSAFIGPCPDGHEAAHLDGNPLNNTLTNLAWVTKKLNQSHKLVHGTAKRGTDIHSAKLNEEVVKQMRDLYLRGATLSAIARQFEVSSSCAKAVIAKATWRHVS